MLDHEDFGMIELLEDYCGGIITRQCRVYQ
jgi:hypothetical protein